MVSTSQLKRRTKRIIKTLERETQKGFDRMTDRRITLGVTGLSGSGKSTFVTSLIHQLQHYPNAKLPAFAPFVQGRFMGAKLRPVPGMPFLDIAQAQQNLSAAPPQWPISTRGLSACELELRFKPRSTLLSKLGRHYERLVIELHDYPGEWLLDLPLLDMNFIQWSCDMNSWLTLAERKVLLQSEVMDQNGQSQTILAWLQKIDPLSAVDPVLLNNLNRPFCAFLKACRQRHMTIVQPGQYIWQEQIEADSFFIPLLSMKSIPADQSLLEGSWLECMAQRYEAYKTHQVRPFYQDHFSRLDRQIILMDLLQPLSGGEPALEEAQVGLSRVLESFEYGTNSLIHRLFRPKIDRLLICASKIDQVLPHQHENIRHLLSVVVRQAYQRARFERADVQLEAVSAIRSGELVKHNQTLLLKGVVLSGQEGVLSHPDIPNEWPNNEQWDVLRQWQVMSLRPPEHLNLTKGGELPHIRMDSVINMIIGDKC